MIRKFWLRLWALPFLLTLMAVIQFVPSATFAYDEQHRARPSYDGHVRLETDYDAASVLFQNEWQTGGRRGGSATRALNNDLATQLENQGFKITGGAGRGAEEWISGPGGGTKGGTFVDITATDGTSTIRIQTVNTYANGAPTASEAAAANKIQAPFPRDQLILIPKRPQ